MDLVKQNKKIKKLKRENNVLKKAYSQTKKKIISSKKTSDRLAADGLRHGSPEAGKYLVGKRKNNY